MILFLTTNLFTSCITAAILSMLGDSSSSSSYESSGYSGSSSTASSSVNLVASKTTDYYWSSYSKGTNPNWTCSLYNDGEVRMYDSDGVLKVVVKYYIFSDASNLYYKITGNDMGYSFDTLEACVSKRFKNWSSEYRNGYVFYYGRTELY